MPPMHWLGILWALSAVLCVFHCFGASPFFGRFLRFGPFFALRFFFKNCLICDKKAALIGYIYGALGHMKTLTLKP